MNATLAALARDKEILLTRSALCRLRLRRETHDLRSTLPWNQAIVAVANAPAARRIAFGLALSVVGVGRATRAVLLAGRLILAARLARLAIGYARRKSRSPVYAIESTATSEGTGQYVDDSVITTKVKGVASVKNDMRLK